MRSIPTSPPPASPTRSSRCSATRCALPRCARPRAIRCWPTSTSCAASCGSCPDMSAAGHHVFLTQTVYHFILSAGIAAWAKRGGGRSTVLFVRDFDRAGEFLEAVRAWPTSPFEAVVDMGAYDRHIGRAARRRSSGRIADEIVGHARRLQPAATYVFNDRHEFAQMLLEATAESFPAATRAYIEDGTAAYSNKVFKPRNWVQRLERRWRYGRRWTDLLCLGTHPLIQRRILLFPDQARPELRQLGALERFPLADLQRTGMESLAGALAQASGYDREGMARADVILAVSSSHIRRRVPDYRDRVRTLLAALRDRGLRVAYKFHPREHEADFVGAGDFYPGAEVPRGLPIEFVTLLADARPRLLLVDFSTALLLSPLLNPAVHGAAFITPG